MTGSIDLSNAAGDWSSPRTVGGWCAHGVPYGPGWYCGQCGSGMLPSNLPAMTFTPEPEGMTREQADEIIALLRRITERLERAR